MNIIASTEEASGYIHQRLRAYNSPYMTDFEDLSFHMEENGEIVAGIVAGRLGDCLEVDFLFVEEHCRHRGLGRQLLDHAEALAREKGVKRVLLNTYSFQAPDFYRSLGYQEAARIEPAFDSHSQFFFVKEL